MSRWLLICKMCGRLTVNDTAVAIPAERCLTTTCTRANLKNAPCRATISAAKKKNWEKNHASPRLLPSSLLLPGVAKYREKKPMNMTAAEIKMGMPSEPNPAFPTIDLKPPVILSRPAPRLHHLLVYSK